MQRMIDETHAPARKSWVGSANDDGCDFPIQNLPLGIFSLGQSGERKLGTAIGDKILDLAAALDLGLLSDGVVADAVKSAKGGSLNDLFAMGPQATGALRRAIGCLLDVDRSDLTANAADRFLLEQNRCRLHRPSRIGNYTDFFASIHHARAAGAQLAPDNPLPPNYKWVPIAYHGRASSVDVSEGVIRRPLGQLPPPTPGASPGFGPSQRLDFELEVGFYVGRGNDLGHPIGIVDAGERIAGFCLLNDWSARDLQRWEMLPLGPFLSKSFATTISPWVVMREALLPFRVPAATRPDLDPRPLDYLFDETDQESGGLEIALSIHLSTSRMRQACLPKTQILRSNARYLYWTFAQMIAHHTIGGCNLEPGDLIGTGTISGPSDDELGSMVELTMGGTRPLRLPTAETRAFLEDGDEVTFSGRCSRPGFVSIGFGECKATVIPAHGGTGA